MVLTVIPGATPCFACFLPDMPEAGSTPTCDTSGVLGSIVGVVASLQGAEVIKLLVGDREAVNPGLITLDVWRNSYRLLKLERNPQCEVCVRRNFRFLTGGDGEMATRLCGRNTVQISPGRRSTIDLVEFSRRLESLGPVHRNEYLLRFSRDNLEITLFPDGRAMIKGTDEISRARATYAKYIGS